MMEFVKIAPNKESQILLSKGIKDPVELILYSKDKVTDVKVKIGNEYLSGDQCVQEGNTYRFDLTSYKGERSVLVSLVNPNSHDVNLRATLVGQPIRHSLQYTRETPEIIWELKRKISALTNADELHHGISNAVSCSAVKNPALTNFAMNVDASADQMLLDNVKAFAKWVFLSTHDAMIVHISNEELTAYNQVMKEKGLVTIQFVHHPKSPRSSLD
jgi:hypothetical protein